METRIYTRQCQSLTGQIPSVAKTNTLFTNPVWINDFVSYDSLLHNENSLRMKQWKQWRDKCLYIAHSIALSLRNYDRDNPNFPKPRARWAREDRIHLVPDVRFRPLIVFIKGLDLDAQVLQSRGRP